ncbi:MAG: hypothetical protein ACRDH5_15075, partial [bacterium]
GQGTVNINTVSKPVLLALRFADTEILTILATRRESPYPNVPGTFTTRGLVANTRMYRIEATGILDGKPRARLTAIVETGEDTNLPAVRVLSWSGIR